MMGREAETLRVSAQIGKPQRTGLGDQQSQDAVTLGKGSDGVVGDVVHADRDELSETDTSLVEDAERAVAGADQLDGRLDDSMQHRLEIEQMHDYLDALDFPLFPWHAGAKHRFVRIEPVEITGRRFHVVDHEEWDDRTDVIRAATE